MAPRNGQAFSADEVNAAYLVASKDSQELSEDREAMALLQEFVTPQLKKEGPKTMQVYTFDEKLPSHLGLKESPADKKLNRGKNHTLNSEVRCACCQIVDWMVPPNESPKDDEGNQAKELNIEAVNLGKKYKPVALKVRPVLAELPERYRIKREITGDPLKDLPGLSPNPADFAPTGRYTLDRKEIIDKIHSKDFLWLEERKLMHHFMMIQNEAFAWDDSERGSFRHDFFPPVEVPVVEHKVWVEKSIPIPRGQLEEVCKIIKKKIDAGVYEPSNASYRTKFFGVVKKDGKSIRLVHSLEPLNAVTIAHSGLPPATDELANHFAGRACGAVLDLYSGYDHRDLAENSRDFTTFQTPFGALRLVKLPQGWTNSVPIFHDDVTYILRDEIPHVTIPYIDDVPIRGPGTRYKNPDGTEETISENKGIRRFVWEHFQNLNRVVQRIKYCGGTFSGTKALLCMDEFPVVGHICSYEGRKPSTDRIGVILRWLPCESVSEVRQFLGVVGVMRTHIKGYGDMARPLYNLTKVDVEFAWGDKEQAAMDEIKAAVQVTEAQKPLNYDWDSDVILAVDTSFRGIGLEVYQCDPYDPKIRYFAKFDAITLNEREARFSQPKRELYGLLRALIHMQYWLLGCRRLVVETDAMYIKGMLSNPGMGPNATINRWIEQILMFHFTLKHVKGATFSPDGLSRRRPAPGDEQHVNPEVGYDENPPPMDHSEWDYSIPQPLDIEEFKDKIDTRGGFLQEVIQDEEYPYFACGVEDFGEQCSINYEETLFLSETIKAAYKSENLIMPQYIMDQTREEEPMLPPPDFKYDPTKRENYPEGHRGKNGIRQDKRIKLVRVWLRDTMKRPNGYSDKEYQNFIRFASKFFLAKNGKLYRRGDGSGPRMVVEKEHRMYMMRAAHDCLGHKGVYSTKSLIDVRFWWPEMERDVKWFVETCHMCQVRQKTLLRTPPTVTPTPSIFQKIYIDVMVMGVTSNKHRLVVAARDALTRWLEARALRAENGETLGKFLLEEIICRWGCPAEIVTDNAGQFLAAIEWLKHKYGITGIRISPYNSQANGPVERGHWDLRQSLYKATGGDTRKWWWFLPQTIWADRITTRRGLGCTPYFAATGAHPTLPLDIEEATWLVEYPDTIISTAELIGLRAKALAKHIQHVEEMRDRVSAEKLAAARRYEMIHEHTIKDFDFKPGSLVLIRNTSVEKSLNTKMSARYLGPMVIVRRTRGGSYLVCELNGAMFRGKIGQFRVVPYLARERIKITDRIEELIDASKETLDALAGEAGEPDPYFGKDMQFHRIKLNPDWKDVPPEELSDEYEDESEEEEVDLGPAPVYDADNPRRSGRKRA